MCVKPIGPVIDGVKVGVYRNCNKSDTWSWTKSGSLQYQKKKCLTAKNGVHPVDEENLVLSSVCDQLHNFIKFVPIGSGWYLYMQNSRSSKRKDSESARFISPNITTVKSCLHFYYRMFGQRAGSLQVYVSSEGSMGFPLKSFYGPRCRGWNRAQVAVNNQTTPYQYVIEGVRGVNDVGNIAIDDICVRDSCSEPLEPEQQPNYRQQNNSQLNATTPPFVKEQKLNTSQLSATTPPSVEEQKLNTSQLNATIPPSVQVCKKANISSEVSSKLPIFIAVNLCVLLLIVVINIIVLVKCRRRDQKPKVLTQDQDNISLTVVESLQGP
ncbi:MAM and LDL-receptor class A domain-containing protein 1-like isoform X2 [Dendronephthya gigantea]|uniref:MAM and LDL-receptor class A domain-containing protein 1-like isoform X2 n=1 Tax=Dendronephthya gigantea TaxID=151771 RepID=UPI001068DBB9|nr:MAM and LDL-receptor class A domain-containing protein 1-like isoform X2 [Dendronephthya gigantea]